LLVAAQAAGATAASAAPLWEINAMANTTTSPGDGNPGTPELRYLIQAENVGDADALGSLSPAVFEAELPAGVTFVSAEFPGFSDPPGWQCPGASVGDSSLHCVNVGHRQGAGEFRRILVAVSVAPETTGTFSSSFAISGAGAANTAITLDPTRVSAILPPFGIDAFDVRIGNAAGGEFTAAAAHPYEVKTSVDFNSATHPNPEIGEREPIQPARSALVDLPPGFVGNPGGVEQCRVSDLAVTEGSTPTSLCSAGSQVGSVVVHLKSQFFPSFAGPLPLFNLVPPPGAAAHFGFNVLGSVITLQASVRRGGDYGLVVGSRGISQGLTVIGSDITFWGVPGDPSHTPERACPGQPAPIAGPTCATGSTTSFLRMPTSCTGLGMPWAIHADSWFNPGSFDATRYPNLSDPAWRSSSIVSHAAPGYPHSPVDNDPSLRWGPELPVTGCDEVPVKGKLTAQPTAIDTETPSGLDVHVEVPNPNLQSPGGITTSDVKEVKVAFPEGMTVNPSQAEGLGACSPAQYDSTELSFHPTDKGCPSDSKIGTVEVKTPLLEETIPGDVYIATPYENPFGSLLALYTVLEEPQRGILIKLPGKVATDPETGQIAATFSDLPQLPFSSFDLRFKEGSRAPLVTPAACGTYETVAEFTGHSDPDGPPLLSKSSFEIARGIGGAPCPTGGKPPFKPGLIAGTRNNNAGSYSPFDLRLFRTDAEQQFTNFSIKLPPGLSGKLAGIPYCPETAIAAAQSPARSGATELASPACPAASEVGRTLVGAGVGPVQAYVPGKVYLAGPYNGSALSMVSVTAAKVGPFDLGTVVVRLALRVNPKTAEVFVDPTGSDPLPHIIDGIPTKLRDIRVYVERPDFTLNPTDCTPTSVASTVLGSGLDFASPADDEPVTVTTRFQAANCAALDFAPKLKIALRGGTKRSQFPALRAELKARPGDANIGRTRVQMPKALFLAQSHLGTSCTRVQFAAAGGAGRGCPANSVYGYARAWTPLLDQPLEGPVYLRSNGGERKLPDLVASLRGVIDIELEGYVDSGKGGGIRTTFAAVPDAPVSKFVLRMKGGEKSLLENSVNLCARDQRAKVEMDGQNGKAHDLRPVLKTRCGKGKRR